MSDGKVMQKYYPPEFDPEAVRKYGDVLKAAQKSKRRRPASGRRRMMEMRMLWPFTVQCEDCQDFNMVGKKFNSRVERVQNETYLGVPIWRIYGRCQHCRNELILKTDPQNTDYILEKGGRRMFDAATAKRQEEEELKKHQEIVESADTVEALEMKALNTAEEVKDLEELDELRRINRRFMALPDALSEMALKKIRDEEEKNRPVIDEDELSDEARDAFLARELLECAQSGEEDEEDEAVELPAELPAKSRRIFHVSSREQNKPSTGVLGDCYDSD